MPDQRRLDEALKWLSLITGVGTIVSWFALGWSWDLAVYALGIAAVLGLLLTSGYLLRSTFKHVHNIREVRSILRSNPPPEQRLKARQIKDREWDELPTALIYGVGTALLAAIAARDIATSLSNKSTDDLDVAAGLGGFFVVLLTWRLIASARRRTAEARESHVRCPDCHERIAREASVCRYCGYRYPDDETYWA